MKYSTPLCVIFTFFLAACSTNNISKESFNIVLITIDTLRADHLSCYGYERETSPAIDNVAEKGILFKNVIAPSSWTAPSMVSLFTSTYPVNHGVIHGVGYRRDETIHIQEVFSDELITLAEILQAHEYTTFGVTSNLHLSEKFGFARGFDYFKCLPWFSAPPVNQEIYSWEDEIKKSEKFFLWVHYFDPHIPYLAQKPWVENYTSQALTEKLNLSNKSSGELEGLASTFKKDPQAVSNLIALYDSEVNFVDSHVGALIEKFELDKNTLVIITSDHGEEFLEHNHLGHGKNLFQETIHIPLIVKLPYSVNKETIETHVNLIDIMPSILQMINITVPDQALGRNFREKEGPFVWLQKIALRRDVPSDYSFSELDTKHILKSITTPEWKYIYNYTDRTEQLYNLNDDPLEVNNLAGKKAKECERLYVQLFNWAANSKKYPTKSQQLELSQEEKEQLEALGYLQTQ